MLRVVHPGRVKDCSRFGRSTKLALMSAFDAVEKFAASRHFVDKVLQSGPAQGWLVVADCSRAVCNSIPHLEAAADLATNYVAHLQVGDV